MRDVLGQRHLLLPGHAGRFTELLPWPALNAILRHHRLAAPRLRLSEDGDQVAEDDYSTEVRTRRGVVYRRLRPHDLGRLLRAGATLVLDAVDELSEPVGRMAASLEQAVREHVQVNAYASWGTTHGFDLHWDDHDVIVIQVAGRKRWAIYGPSRPYPLFRDAEPNRRPPDAPCDELMLTDGDVLHVPRGWWHIATAVAEPSLHLTAGISRDTGIDLMAWLTDELRADERFRRDLPRHAGPGGLPDHLRMLRKALGEHLDGDGLLHRFFDAQDATAPVRPAFSLPHAATPERLPPGDDLVVSWLAPRAVLSAGDGPVRLAADGSRWEFAPASQAVLAALAQDREVRLDDLVELGAQRGLDRQTVRAFVGELLTMGLVAVS